MRVIILRGFIVFALIVLAGLPYEAEATMIRDTEIEEYLQGIIRPMAREAGVSPDEARVRVVINPAYNAFVRGDGFIYINSGLILKADNMLEIAGVLAHELGHIAAGHVRQRSEVIREANKVGLLGAAAAIALTAAGGGGAAVGVLAGSIDSSQRIIYARSRQDEGVADEWAIKLMQSQMFSLYPMANTMRELASQRLLPQGRQSEYYLTHPGMLERSAVFQDHINRFEREALPTPIWMERTFERLKAKLLAWTIPPKTTLLTTQDDNTPLARYRGAIADFRLSKHQDAIATMQKLIQEFPNDPFYHEFLGDILLSEGDSMGAVRQYEASLARMQGSDINKGQILLALGRAYMAMNNPQDYSKAIKHLEAANRFEPEWAFARRQLGIAYGKMGDEVIADLTLAEEALLRQQDELAIKLAERAKANPKATPQQRQIANDIIVANEPQNQ